MFVRGGIVAPSITGLRAKIQRASAPGALRGPVAILQRGLLVAQYRTQVSRGLPYVVGGLACFFAMTPPTPSRGRGWPSQHWRGYHGLVHREGPFDMRMELAQLCRVQHCRRSSLSCARTSCHKAMA